MSGNTFAFVTIFASLAFFFTANIGFGCRYLLLLHVLFNLFCVIWLGYLLDTRKEKKKLFATKRIDFGFVQSSSHHKIRYVPAYGPVCYFDDYYLWCGPIPIPICGSFVCSFVYQSDFKQTIFFSTTSFLPEASNMQIGWLVRMCVVYVVYKYVNPLNVTHCFPSVIKKYCWRHYIRLNVSQECGLYYVPISSCRLQQRTLCNIVTGVENNLNIIQIFAQDRAVLKNIELSRGQNYSLKIFIRRPSLVMQFVTINARN